MAADNVGFCRHGLSIFSVNVACFNNLHHRCIRKAGSVPARIVLKCLLNVRIARSATLMRCMWSGVS
eukprot:3941021-Ditylum_brightwellii.AAC.1